LLVYEYENQEVNDVISKMNGPKNYLDIGMKVPLNIFLSHEIERMRNVLQRVKTDLKNVVNFTNGKISNINNEVKLQDFLSNVAGIVNSIYAGQVPRTWNSGMDIEFSWSRPS